MLGRLRNMMAEEVMSSGILTLARPFPHHHRKSPYEALGGAIPPKRASACCPPACSERGSQSPALGNPSDLQPALYTLFLPSWPWLFRTAPAVTVGLVGRRTVFSHASLRLLGLLFKSLRVLIAFGAGSQLVGRRPLRRYIHGMQALVSQVMPCFLA